MSSMRFQKGVTNYSIEDQFMAYILRNFSQETNICFDRALVAADAGPVVPDEDVVSAGGTSHEAGIV